MFLRRSFGWGYEPNDGYVEIIQIKRLPALAGQAFLV